LGGMVWGWHCRWGNSRCRVGTRRMLTLMCLLWTDCRSLLHRKGMRLKMRMDCTCLLHRGCTMADRCHCTCLLHRKGMRLKMCLRRMDCRCLLHRGCTMADRCHCTCLLHKKGMRLKMCLR
jgi:hypothetical protein